jgi:predicted amidohydrolase YtcJ
MLLPGFQDAHVHPYTSGIDHYDCDLDIQPQTVQEYLGKIAECAAAFSERAWISGGGWAVTAFPPNGIPHKALLDEVVPDRPAVFFSIDGHSAWANSRALEIAGITAETDDPPNGRIDRDPVTGEPVGSLQEAAMGLVRAQLPPPPPEQRAAAMRYAADYLHRLGITAIQEANARVDADDPLEMLETYRQFAERGELQLRTSISLGWDDRRGLEQIATLEAARDRYERGPLRASTVKIFLDGVVEPHTAALLQDYSDRPGYRGELQVPPDVLNEAVARLDAAGFQVHIHVIGDAAVRAALDAFEFARDRNGATGNRHHLAHVEFVDPADIPRFAELDVTATFSPLWAVEDAYLTELTLPRVGPERYRWTYPINSILQARGRIAFGSDWNVSSPDPLLAIETAVTRVEPLRHGTPAFFPQERISLEQALAAATLNAAYVNHLDDRSGSLEVGKLADLVLLDRNLFEIEPAEISEAKVVLTLVGGEVVYRR